METLQNKDSELVSLVATAKRITKMALVEASQTDAVDAFPEKTLAEIKESKLFVAGISSAFGGADLGLLPGTNLAMLQILKYIGAGNLVMGRVLEGHLNAQLLLNQFADEAQKKMFAADAFNGKLFGVWNTQAGDGTSFTSAKTDINILNGSKTFATGMDYVTRPIVTAALPDGSWQMCIVPIDEINTTKDTSWWHPMGMRASRSYKVGFNDAPINAANMIGDADSYYQQPGFSGGAIRFAAVQLGAAETLVEETRNYLQSLNRIDDPYQKLRIGQMTIHVTSGNQWIHGAAEQLDNFMIDSSEANSARFLAFANMMRTAIEQICVAIMELCQKCVGARGLNAPYHFGRIIRDLNTYLRQPAPDASLADIGLFVLQSETPFNDLWNLKK